MNKLLATLVFAVSVNAFAVDAAPKADDVKHQEMFSKMKQLRIDGIQGRISVLQTALSCVNAANSHEEMKPCHEQEEKAMKTLREKQKDAMAAMRSAGDRK